MAEDSKSEKLRSSKREAKKKQQEKKTEVSDSRKENWKKQPFWRYEWTSPKLFASDGNFGIHEVVHGPFASPRLVKASPCVFLDSATSNISSCASDRKTRFRSGIPDPWNEYLALRGYCTSYDKKIAKRHLRLGCDRVRLTEAVWNDLGLTLTQGIPDPWKNSPYELTDLPERRKRGKSRIKLQGASRDSNDLTSTKLKDIFSRQKIDPEDSANLSDQEQSLEHKKVQEKCDFDAIPSKEIAEMSSQVDSRILEENVKKSGIKFRRDEKTSSFYHCRVCRPEVTPTTCSKATKIGQENFWRCIRHQPGASYRLKASQLSGGIPEQNEPSFTTVEPENVEPETDLCSRNEKTVTSMMKKLLRSWKDKNQLPEEAGALENEEISQINLICCQCHCPYLKTAEYDGSYFANNENEPLCQKCACTKCIRRRVRREQRKMEKSQTRDKQIPKEMTQIPGKSATDENCGQHLFPNVLIDEPVTKVAEAELPDAGIGDCRISGIARYVSPESGANADISDASIRTICEVEATAVMSSTFINSIQKKPKTLMSDEAGSDDSKTHSSSTRRKNARRKPRANQPNDQSDEKNEKPEPKSKDDAPGPRKHVSYETKKSQVKKRPVRTESPRPRKNLQEPKENVHFSKNLPRPVTPADNRSKTRPKTARKTSPTLKETSKRTNDPAKKTDSKKPEVKSKRRSPTKFDEKTSKTDKIGKSKPPEEKTGNKSRKEEVDILAVSRSRPKNAFEIPQAFESRCTSEDDKQLCVQNESIEPFVREISEDEGKSTDDPEIECMPQQTEKFPRFLANENERNVRICFRENCGKREFHSAPQADDLFLQSYSETDDNLQK